VEGISQEVGVLLSSTPDFRKMAAWQRRGEERPLNGKGRKGKGNLQPNAGTLLFPKGKGVASGGKR